MMMRNTKMLIAFGLVCLVSPARASLSARIAARNRRTNFLQRTPKKRGERGEAVVELEPRNDVNDTGLLLRKDTPDKEEEERGIYRQATCNVSKAFLNSRVGGISQNSSDLESCSLKLEAARKILHTIRENNEKVETNDKAGTDTGKSSLESVKKICGKICKVCCCGCCCCGCKKKGTCWSCVDTPVGAFATTGLVGALGYFAAYIPNFFHQQQGTPETHKANADDESIFELVKAIDSTVNDGGFQNESHWDTLTAPLAPIDAIGTLAVMFGVIYCMIMQIINKGWKEACNPFGYCVDLYTEQINKDVKQSVKQVTGEMQAEMTVRGYEMQKSMLKGLSNTMRAPGSGNAQAHKGF